MSANLDADFDIARRSAKQSGDIVIALVVADPARLSAPGIDDLATAHFVGGPEQRAIWSAIRNLQAAKQPIDLNAIIGHVRDRDGVRGATAPGDGMWHRCLDRLNVTRSTHSSVDAEQLLGVHARKLLEYVPQLHTSYHVEADAMAFEAKRGRATAPPPDDAPHPVEGSPPPRPDIDEQRLTEIGNARRFASTHGHRLRYVQSWGRWLSWDGQCWCRDELGAEMVAAKAIADSLYAEVARLAARAAAGDDAAAALVDPLTKWARASSKANACSAMLKLARSEDPIAAAASQFDRDPYVLNVANGTLDLRAGRLGPHKQTDMITKLAPVDYHPNARCPEWERFLVRVLPDPEVRGFVQRFVGYCLTGDVSEHALAFVYGLGANGKSVLLDVMLALLGDYGCRAAPDLVLAKHGESHPTELADLEGRRFVVCSEIEQGRAWAEALIKRITGDTTISARHMKQDFYTFPATHKLWIAANTKPTARGTDEGIWRRMRLVPFDVTIPPGERDKKLVARLIASELPGILTWAVAGCLAWQRDGLGAPAAVDKATTAYREEQDVLGLWIAEECIIAPGRFSSTAALYAAFTAWCHRTGRHPWTQQTMRERLVERAGITPGRSNAARGLDGIGLIDPRRNDEDNRVKS